MKRLAHKQFSQNSKKGAGSVPTQLSNVFIKFQQLFSTIKSPNAFFSHIKHCQRLQSWPINNFLRILKKGAGSVPTQLSNVFMKFSHFVPIKHCHGLLSLPKNNFLIILKKGARIQAPCIVHVASASIRMVVWEI